MEVEDIMILEGYLTWDDVYDDGSYIKDCKFSKLQRGHKNLLKEIIISVAKSYWTTYHIIPFGSELKQLKEQVVAIFAKEYRLRIKEEKVFNDYFFTQVICIINRLLKEENKGHYASPNIKPSVSKPKTHTNHQDDDDLPF